MPTLLHSVAVGTLAVLLSACQADPTTTPAATSATAQADAPAAGAPDTAPQDIAGMLASAGITCPQAAPGPDSAGCSAGLAANGEPYAVQLQGACNDDGFYAAVFQADGARVLPRLPTQPAAADTDGPSLADQQFVCIKAIARQGQSAAYYYVQAMDPAQVAACHDDATCQEYRPPAGAACTVTTPQGCTSGWVEADALEVFSNGIGASAL